MSMLHKRQFAKGYVPGFQKTYLSREMTRAMALDHPIGDPHGGPAFGERNDPISAIISIGSMFAAGGGLTAAGFSLASMSLASGLVFAGSALSLIGNITGNKTLSKIGMVVGIAGGLGNLFDVGTSSTVGEMFGMDSAAVTSGAPSTALANTPTAAPSADVSGAIVDGGAIASPTVAPGDLSLADAGPLGGSAPGTVATPEPAAPLAGTPAVATSPVPRPGDLNASALGAPAGTTVAAPTAADVAAPKAAMSFDSFGNSVPAGSAAELNADPTGLAQRTLDANAAAQPQGFVASLQAGKLGDAASAAWGGIKDLGSSWMSLAKTNPAMATMMGSAITSVADVLSGKADATVRQLEASGSLSQAQADKLRFEMEDYKRRIAQQNANYTNVANPLATWKPPAVSGNAVPAVANRGLIGGAMAAPGP